MEELTGKIRCGQQFNPLQYCFGDEQISEELYGSINVRDTRQAQAYASEYCSKKWDRICEISSINRDPVINMLYPNSVTLLSRGEVLLRNTVITKYMTSIKNAEKRQERLYQLDSTSPVVTYWSKKHISRPIQMEFSVNHTNIDNDPVMNKLLLNPNVALDVLKNIYKNLKKQGNLDKLQNTKLGLFYKANGKYFN